MATNYLPKKQITAISILPRSDKAIQESLDVAYQDSLVTTILSKYQQKGHKGFLVHLMPVQT
jgi:hypothetical protein